MRVSLWPLLVAATLFLTCVAAWTNEDHEIFDIVLALEAAEGKGTTFYSFLNLTKSATDKDISKAYRKRSLELQSVNLAFFVSLSDSIVDASLYNSPDKNPDDAVIADRFARLGVISNILRDAEKRKRYDFFHDNGVPKWRGTGYYYSRYRPGLRGVLIGLIAFSCAVQYFVLAIMYKLNDVKINQFRKQARDMAWGEGKPAGAGKRRLKVKTGEQVDPLGTPGINNGKPIGPNSTIELSVEGENVFVIENGRELLFTNENNKWPAWRDTWVPKVILGQSRKYMAKFGLSDEQIVTRDGKEVIVKKPKGPTRPVELSGKVGGRRRVVRSRPSTPVNGKGDKEK
ncbi:hypothetical protein OIV83_004181 [Microbotryomycetes sp. JL201]|nr:hypothetical protein OIV83_004181 [Microbotryomycetes sp. JL201]